MALPIANAGADQTFNEAALPVTANLSGGGTPGTGGTSITGYLWAVMPGGAAGPSLSSTVIQNPTFGPINAWESWRIFLRVQDNLGNWSEADPLIAPTSAFVNIHVRSTDLQVVKPSAGMRNYHPLTNEFYDETNTLKNDFDNHTIASHDTSATGAELDTLTDGSDATSLHIHTPANPSLKGFIMLDEAAVDPVNPKAVTRDRIVMPLSCPGTCTALGFVPGAVMIPNDPAASDCILDWWVREDMYLVEACVRMKDSGDDPGAGVYTFRFYQRTVAQYLAAAGGTALAAAFNVTPNAHAPILTTQSIGVTLDVVANGPVIVMDVQAVPTTYGAGMVVDLCFERRV